MSNKAKIPSIPDTEEAWDTGALGRDMQFAESVPNDMESVINEHLDLQPISIRLEKSLIEDFKLIASLNGMGYQPLMRQTLKRFADCEKKRILRELAADVAAKKREDASEQSRVEAEQVHQQKRAA